MSTAVEAAFQLFNIPSIASKREMLTAYRSKVRQYHPDRNKEPEAKKKWHAIQSAKTTLETFYDSHLVNPKEADCDLSTAISSASPFDSSFDFDTTTSPIIESSTSIVTPNGSPPLFSVGSPFGFGLLESPGTLERALNDYVSFTSPEDGVSTSSIDDTDKKRKRENENDRFLQKWQDYRQEVLRNAKKASNLLQAFEQLGVHPSGVNKHHIFVLHHSDGLRRSKP